MAVWVTDRNLGKIFNVISVDATHIHIVDSSRRLFQVDYLLHHKILCLVQQLQHCNFRNERSKKDQNEERICKDWLLNGLLYSDDCERFLGGALMATYGSWVPPFQCFKLKQMSIWGEHGVRINNANGFLHSCMKISNDKKPKQVYKKVGTLDD